MDYESEPESVNNEYCGRMKVEIGYFSDTEAMSLQRSSLKLKPPSRHQLQRIRRHRQNEGKKLKQRYKLALKQNAMSKTESLSSSLASTGVWNSPPPAIIREQIPDRTLKSPTTVEHPSRRLNQQKIPESKSLTNIEARAPNTQTKVVETRLCAPVSEPDLERNEAQVSDTCNVSDILGCDSENDLIAGNKKKDVIAAAFEDFKSSGGDLITCDSRKSRISVRIIRILNFIRAIFTSVYGIYAISQIFNNPVYVNLGAQPFFIASYVFFSIDLLFAIIKAFPRLFWRCWNVETWDPFAKTFSIWNMVADHEMILDSIPILANLILKVYGYRLSEYVALISLEEASRTTAFGLKQVTVNQILLMIYAITLLLTLLTHTLRLCGTLMLKKKAYTLSILVFIKVCMLSFDLYVNAQLLYSVLVYKQGDLFQLSLIPSLVISVFAASTMVVLATNFIVNYPLHIFHIRMSLRSIGALRGISLARISAAAFRKTFNPFIMAIFGTYSAYSLGALLYILYEIYNISTKEIIEEIPSSMFNSWTGFNQLLSLLWFNVVINYLCGIVSSLIYWLVQVLSMLKSIWLLRAICCCNKVEPTEP